jgi:hypothetical protein
MYHQYALNSTYMYHQYALNSTYMYHQYALNSTYKTRGNDVFEYNITDVLIMLSFASFKKWMNLDLNIHILN